jgi:hypothetical protein
MSAIKRSIGEHDTRHGGAFDRGRADSYYNRLRSPHYFAGATLESTEIHEVMMTAEQIEAYHAGYDWNERYGDKKCWN